MSAFLDMKMLQPKSIVVDRVRGQNSFQEIVQVQYCEQQLFQGILKGFGHSFCRGDRFFYLQPVGKSDQFFFLCYSHWVMLDIIVRTHLEIKSIPLLVVYALQTKVGNSKDPFQSISVVLERNLKLL